MGNGLTTTRTFDTTNYPKTITAGNTANASGIQDLKYSWFTSLVQNQRIDGRGTSASSDDYVDSFNPDALRRLASQITTSPGGNRTLGFSYDELGNVTSKTSSVAATIRLRWVD